MACLHKALDEKRFLYVTMNLNWGEDPEYQDEKGRTLLMKLSSFERDTKWSVATVRRLMKIPGTRDVVDHEGRDILMYCIKHKKIGMAKLVLSDPDFRIDKTDRFGYNSLHYAAEMGVVPIVRGLLELLVQYEMNVDVITPPGMTALMLACRAGHVECARVLVNEGFASVSMKDDKHFKGAKSWLADSYTISDDIDPFDDEVNLVKKQRCKSARGQKRRSKSLTSMRRTQSMNCILTADLINREANAVSTPRILKPPMRDGFFTYSAITPVKHLGPRKVECKYPNTPTIIFEDAKGKMYKPPSPTDDDKSEDSYVPVLYKLFNDSSVQTSHSFRPPVRKPRTPSPEPEPEPEPEEPEVKSEPESPQKVTARNKLKKAMRMRKTEGFLDTLKKGARKNSAPSEKGNVRSMNINDLMSNLKKRQTKSEPGAHNQHNSAVLATEKLKEKFGKLKKMTKQITNSDLRRSGHSNTSDGGGVNMDVSGDSVFN